MTTRQDSQGNQAPLGKFRLLEYHPHTFTLSIQILGDTFADPIFQDKPAPVDTSTPVIAIEWSFSSATFWYIYILDRA